MRACVRRIFINHVFVGVFQYNLGPPKYTLELRNFVIINVFLYIWLVQKVKFGCLKECSLVSRSHFLSVSSFASGILFNPKTVKSQIQGGIYSVKLWWEVLWEIMLCSDGSSNFERRHSFWSHPWERLWLQLRIKRRYICTTALLLHIFEAKV